MERTLPGQVLSACSEEASHAITDTDKHHPFFGSLHITRGCRASSQCNCRALFFLKAGAEGMAAHTDLSPYTSTALGPAVMSARRHPSVSSRTRQPGRASAGTQEGSGPTIVLNSLPCQPACALLKSGSTSCCVRFGGGFSILNVSTETSGTASLAATPSNLHGSESCWFLPGSSQVSPVLLHTAAVLGGAEPHSSTAADPINTAASSDRVEPQLGDSSFLTVLLADVPTHTAAHQLATAISTAAL